MTASSVTTRSTEMDEASGSEHSQRAFDRLFAVCCMATIMRLAPATRSIALPISGTKLPGTIRTWFHLSEIAAR